MVFFDVVFGAAELLGVEDMVIVVDAGRDAEEGRVGVGKMELMDLRRTKSE